MYYFGSNNLFFFKCVRHLKWSPQSKTFMHNRHKFSLLSVANLRWKIKSRLVSSFSDSFLKWFRTCNFYFWLVTCFFEIKPIFGKNSFISIENLILSFYLYLLSEFFHLYGKKINPIFSVILNFSLILKNSLTIENAFTSLSISCLKKVYYLKFQKVNEKSFVQLVC